jgi:N-acetylmuramoyl-L-alanine amidase
MAPLPKPLLAASLAALLGLLAVGAAGPATASSSARRAEPPRPRIVQWPIPFGHKRKREMAAYSKRHYGHYQWRLRHPHVIVEHMAQASTAEAVHDAFAPDVPDVELGELPNVCAHFVLSHAGKIFQLVKTRIRCRHTVGLNWTAIGIEHAGFADSDLLGDRRQLRASLRLTQYLRCHYGIGVKNVIGHNESLSSPYHFELVPSLRHQTHGDMKHGSMKIYRRDLRRLGAC